MQNLFFKEAWVAKFRSDHALSFFKSSYQIMRAVEFEMVLKNLAWS